MKEYYVEEMTESCSDVCSPGPPQLPFILQLWAQWQDQ